MDQSQSLLIDKVKELLHLLMIDEGGLPPPFPSGNGGLLSRATLNCANEIRKILHDIEARKG